MLKPAILYKNQITNGFQEYYYTDDMMYETGSTGIGFPRLQNFQMRLNFNM